MKRSLMIFGVALAAVAAVADSAVRRTHDGKIVIDGDKYAMNWILDPDGAQYDFLTPDCKWGTLRLPKSLDGKIADSLSRRQDGGDLVETLTISNLAGAPVVLEGASICFPFNDNYPDAKECVERRCNAHLWPFGSAAWACCMRMGGEGPHLGWMLTKGEVDGYEVNFRGRDRGSSNFRGVFSFRIPTTTLAAGESLTLEWRLFSHAGWDDFFAQLEKRGSFVPHRDSYVIEDAARPGERIERVEQGGKWTRVETLAISNFRDFIFRRLDFVLANQQYDAPGDIRDGAAYLYPDRLDGRPGRYLDPMANDQDWALVFASRWLEEYSGATLERDVAFILKHAPEQDLPLDGNFVTNNCRLAAAARAAAIEKCPDDIYLDYVLPYSVIREEVDDWRGEFRERFLPLVEGCKDNYEAAVKLDRTIWDMIGVHYDTRRDKARQSPRHSMRIGMASCTGISIILIDACRAVGIPARLVGCCWTTIPGNHSWVEVWSGGRWRVLASGEKEREDDIWFLDYAAQADASRIDRRIYASRYSPSPSGTRFWRTWEYPHGVSDVPADDVTARYAKTGK